MTSNNNYIVHPCQNRFQNHILDEAFVSLEDIQDNAEEPSFADKSDVEQHVEPEHWPSALTPHIFLNNDDDYVDLHWTMASPLSKVWPTEFWGYFDEFCRYFKCVPYAERKSYEKDWYSCDKMWEERKVQQTEMHLDLWHTYEYLRIERPNIKWKMPKQYWLGLRPSEKPKARFPHGMIDVDNKNRLGWYDDNWSATSSIRPESSLHPVMFMDVAHLKKIARIYQQFPNLIWCISSRSLGLHLYEKLPRPLTIRQINERYKPHLRRIGADTTEIYPMVGQACRRPFGKDFFTIAKVGCYQNWIAQWNYYCNPGPTPSIQEICNVLLALLREQWMAWLDVPRLHHRKLNKIDPAVSLRKFTFDNGKTVFPLDELQRMVAWVEDGCNTKEPVSVSLGGMPPPQAGAFLTETELDSILSRPLVTKAVQHNRPLKNPSRNKPNSFEGDNPECFWTADLEEINRSGLFVEFCVFLAKEGYPCDDRFVQVNCALARWFTVELDEPDETDISELLINFARNKNNGYITRLLNGNKKAVFQEIRRIVKSVMETACPKWEKVKDDLRNKRSSGYYAQNFHLAPIILDTDKDMRSILCVPLRDTDSCVSSPLPERFMTMIRDEFQQAKWKLRKSNGRYPVLDKLARFINYLNATGGKRRVSQPQFKKLGFRSNDEREKIKQLLKKAGLLEWGGYSKIQHQGRLYLLTTLAMDLLRDQ